MPSYKQVFYTAINNSPVAISITKQEMPMEQYVQMISQDVAYKMRKLVDIMEGRPGPSIQFSTFRRVQDDLRS